MKPYILYFLLISSKKVIENKINIYCKEGKERKKEGSREKRESSYQTAGTAGLPANFARK
jgi:hypothetical protein